LYQVDVHFSLKAYPSSVLKFCCHHAGSNSSGQIYVGIAVTSDI